MVDEHCRPYLIAADIYPFAAQRSLIVTPTGDIYEIDWPPDAIQALLRECDGSRTVADLAATTPEILDILAVLAEGHSIAWQQPTPAEAQWRRFAAHTTAIDASQLHRTHLLLVGHTELITRVLTLADGQPFASVTVADTDALAVQLAAYPTGEVVLLALYAYEDVAALTQIDTLCAKMGVRWLSLRLAQGCAWLGPAIIPGHTAHYRDLLDRRAMAAESPVLHNALLAPPRHLPNKDLSATLPPPSELAWIVALLFSELQRWIVGAPCRLISVELCADPLTYTQCCYPLLPSPHQSRTNPLMISASRDSGLLFNSRSGIITDLLELCHHPAIPRGFRTIQARLAQNPDWLNDPLSMSSLYDPQHQGYSASSSGFQAAQPLLWTEIPPQALLHAAKYYCDSNFYAAQVQLASYDQLRRMGEYALDPQQLTLFSAALYATPGCPFVPFTHDTPAYWVRGHALIRDDPAWIPANLAYVNWQLADFVQEAVPMTQTPSYSGLAAGWSLEAALVSAIEDCIRRDTMMIWWLNRQPLPAIQPSAELAALWQGEPTELGQRAWLIYLPNQFGLPVIAGVLENRHEQLLTIGFGYGADPVAAALQAWAEAATSQEASRDMNDPHGLTRQSVEQGMLHTPFKPWRADRAYLDDYRSDFRDMTDPLVQRQFYLDPRAIERVRPWIDVPATLHFADIPTLPDRSLAAYRQRLAALGFELFWLDLTPPDLAVVGLKVVRVVIPGLVPNFPAAFPATGGGRVQQVPLLLGWRNTPRAEEDLNYMPLPGA